jgi:hypothetical protein
MMGILFEELKTKYSSLMVRRAELEQQIIKNIDNHSIVSELRKEFREIVDALEETMNELIKVSNGKEIQVEAETNTAAAN